MSDIKHNFIGGDWDVESDVTKNRNPVNLDDRAPLWIDHA